MPIACASVLRVSPDASLRYPSGLAVDSAGNFYLSSPHSHRIRKVDVSTGIITTVAGDGVEGNSGDGGLATSARMNWPTAVYADGSGNIYITDTGNKRLVVLGPGDDSPRALGEEGIGNKG